MPDINHFGTLKTQKDKLEKAIGYMSCFGTAKVGYIYAKATPRNAGKFMIRCSDPMGKCFGQIPLEIAQSRVECACG